MTVHVKAYHRRRGWLAWHVAALVRWGEGEFPAIEDLTGEEPPERPVQSEAQMLHSLSLWEAATNLET